MKLFKLKASILIALLGYFSACNGSIEKDHITLIQENIETVILKSIDDPASYTFVEIQVSDTTYYYQIIQDFISINEQVIQETTDRLNHDKQFLAGLEERSGEHINDPDIQNILRPYKESISSFEAKIQELNNTIKAANEISPSYDHNTFFLSLTYAYRANNEFGALQLTVKEYEVQKYEDGVQILWSGDKELIDECRMLNYEPDGVFGELCISVFENNARSQLISKIEAG